MTENITSIAIVGGTGKLGSGLAYQLSRQGYSVLIGSRDEGKAQDAAAEIAARTGREVVGLGNAAAAAAAEAVIMTVPWAHHRSTLEGISSAAQGKILVDTTVPLVPPKVSRVHIPEEGMAGVQAQRFLGDNVRVVSAFQTVAASHLQEEHFDHEGDVLVCGNDPEAREWVVKLAESFGLRAWHAGPIENCAVSETLTSALIFMNRYYKFKGAGIRVAGEPGEAA